MYKTTCTQVKHVVKLFIFIDYLYYEYFKFIFCCSFIRGKDQGHDVDLLLSHPQESKEIGLLSRLLRRLDQLDLIVYGRHEESTFTKDALKKDSKTVALRGSLDHFEKWIGVLKVEKSFRTVSHTNIADDTKNNSKTGNSSGLGEPNQDELASQTPPGSLDCSKPSFIRQSSLTSAVKLAQEERSWYARRVDLIVVPASQYYYALVGWTGSKHFNRSLRLYAQRQLDMKLTSHGLFDVRKVSFCFLEWYINKVIVLMLERSVFSTRKESELWGSN